MPRQRARIKLSKYACWRSQRGSRRDCARYSCGIVSTVRLRSNIHAQVGVECRSGKELELHLKGGTMYFYRTAVAVLLLWVPVLADDASARAQLIGAWQQQDASGKGISVWVLENKANSLHITNSQGDQKLSEIECRPTGAECEGTASGKKIKVAMYFNGPTLVHLETVGSDITKRQFTVKEQPDVMEIEVMPIIGNAKSETLHLKRMPLSAGNR
jgi:hypothetical protein